MRAADAHPSRRAAWHDHGRATPVYFRGRQNGWILASGEADSRPCGDGGNQDVFVLQPQIAVTRKPLMSVERRLLEYGSKIDGRLYVYGFQTLYPHLSSELSDGAQTGLSVSGSDGRFRPHERSNLYRLLPSDSSRRPGCFRYDIRFSGG